MGSALLLLSKRIKLIVGKLTVDKLIVGDVCSTCDLVSVGSSKS